VKKNPSQFSLVLFHDWQPVAGRRRSLGSGGSADIPELPLSVNLFDLKKQFFYFGIAAS